MTPGKMASKALQGFYLPLGEHASFRPTLYTHSIFTVYRFPQTTYCGFMCGIFWRHNSAHLNQGGDNMNMQFVYLTHKSETTSTAGSNNLYFLS